MMLLRIYHQGFVTLGKLDVFFFFNAIFLPQSKIHKKIKSLK